MWGGVGVDPNDRLTKTDASQVLRRAARLARPYWRTAFAAVGFVALATSTTIVGPLLVRYGIDTGILTAFLLYTSTSPPDSNLSRRTSSA